MGKIKEFLEKYKVILILFVYLVGMSYFLTQSNHSNFMFYLMGLFFIIFSFFKVIHLPEFKSSFQKYDYFAKNIPFYGLLYPFIEIMLGIFFLLGLYINIISIITVVILSVTTIGIISQLRKGKILECACLGVVFKLPLSNVTIFENCTMIIMALIQIL